MPNFLEALRQYKLKAAQDPRLKDVEVTQSIMPFLLGAGTITGLKAASPGRINTGFPEGKFGLSSVPSEAAKAIPKLGQMNPEFTAVGEEALYNATKFPRIAKTADDIEAAYQRILASMLRGRK